MKVPVFTYSGVEIISFICASCVVFITEQFYIAAGETPSLPEATVRVINDQKNVHTTCGVLGSGHRPFTAEFENVIQTGS
jgi:protein involved in ribonucleotide reduction